MPTYSNYRWKWLHNTWLRRPFYILIVLPILLPLFVLHSAAVEAVNVVVEFAGNFRESF